MTPRTQKIIQESATLSVHAGQSYIGTEHLLLALLGEGDCVAVRLLDDPNIPVDELKRDVQNFLGASPGAENIGQSRSAGNENQSRAVRRSVAERQGEPPHGEGACRHADAGTVRARSRPPWRGRAGWIPSSGGRPRPNG